MRFNLKRVVGISAIPLLGGALAVGAAASSASAQAWQDTSLQVNYLHSTSNAPGQVTIAPTPTQFGKAGTVTVSRASASDTLTVSWAMSKIPKGMTVSNSGGVVTVTGLKSAPASIIQGTLVVDDTSGSGAATAWIVVFHQGPAKAQTTGLGTDYYYSDTPGAITRSYPVGGMQFGETSNVVASASTNPVLSPAPAYSFAYHGLPNGIVNNSAGRFTIAGSTAAPGTYGSVGVTATDQYGARSQSTFQLVVKAQPVYVPGSYGDMVNPFGNGFDVYQQHQVVNAIVAGWTPTQADPATHFIRHPGTIPGAYTYEYAPNGVGTGLSVSDPGYDAAGTGLKDGLVLRASNNGSWQQFVPQPNGTLKNVATGLVVSPNGTGAQLRGTVAATPWGGSVYKWTDFAHLPR